MKNFFILCFLILIACKKEKKPDSVVLEPSERFKILTGNKWAMTHEYIDSTAYAKNHLNEWPLSTTDDFMDIYDTCSLESKTLFLPDGKVKLDKSPACSSSVSENVGNWKLTNNDNDFVIVGQDTLHIVELNHQNLKMYYEQYTTLHGQLVLVEYCMWTYEAR